MRSLTGLAEKDLLYIADTFIDRQIHICNPIDPAEKDLLNDNAMLKVFFRFL